MPASRRRERAGAGDVRAGRARSCRPRPAHAHDRLDELGLPVALDARDAEDLAARARRGRRRRAAAGPVVGGEPRPVDAQHLPVGDGGVAGLRASGSSLPTIISASRRVVTVRGSAVPTVVPRRITVIGRRSRGTSSSLWEMNRNVKPSARMPRRVSNRSSTSCGTSTAVGSSRMSDAGAAVEHLEDLDALPVGRRRAARRARRGRRRGRRRGQLGDPRLRPARRCRAAAPRRAGRSPRRSGCRPA